MSFGTLETFAHISYPFSAFLFLIGGGGGGGEVILCFVELSVSL